MVPPKKSKEDRPQAGSSSAMGASSGQGQSSSEEDNVPLAALRKDAKGKIKKSSKGNESGVVSEATKVPKGKHSGVVSEATKVPKGKGKQSGVISDAGNSSSSKADAKKVPKGKASSKPGTSGTVQLESSQSGTSSMDVANTDDEASGNATDVDEADLILTPAEASQGWSITKRRRVMKVRLYSYNLSSYKGVQMSKIVVLFEVNFNVCRYRP